MKLVLMIGIPGSGKSTLAKQLSAEAEARGERAVICSADDFLMVDGQYRWEARKLGWAHRSCKDKARQACVDKTELIIIDNTNLDKRDRRKYLNLAAEFGYQTEIKVVGEFTEEFAKVCAARQIHGVSVETLLRMVKKAQLPSSENK